MTTYNVIALHPRVTTNEFSVKYSIFPANSLCFAVRYVPVESQGRIYDGAILRRGSGEFVVYFMKYAKDNSEDWDLFVRNTKRINGTICVPNECSKPQGLHVESCIYMPKEKILHSVDSSTRKPTLAVMEEFGEF